MPNPFSFQTILAAKSGANDVLAAVLHYYDPYIAFFSKRPFFDEYGNRYDLIDEEIRQHIENRLIFQIVYRFNPNKLPDGETLDEN